MFGGLLGKLLRWGIIGGIALVLATQLLSSVSWIVISMRLGDFLPFTVVCIVSLLLQRISFVIKTNSRIAKILVDALAGASMLYMFFVVLVGFLPFGLIISISCAGCSLLLSMITRDPSSFRKTILEFVDNAEIYHESGMLFGNSRDGIGRRFIERGDIEILQVPTTAFDDVIRILRNRPMLPASLIHLQDADFLIVQQADGSDWFRQIRRVLQDEGIFDVSKVSALLKKTILLLPLIEEIEGYPISDYAVAAKEQSVDALLEAKPLRMTVFPSSDGIKVLARKDSMPGIELVSIPNAFLQQIVIARNSDAIKNVLDDLEGAISAY